MTPASAARATQSRNEELGPSASGIGVTPDALATGSAWPPLGGAGARPDHSITGSATLYSISWSAPSKNASGMVSPIALAVFMLMTISNLVVPDARCW